MVRTAFLVDGFNLMHAVLDSDAEVEASVALWLDLPGLARTQVQLLGPDHQLVGIEYFTALASHREVEQPGITRSQVDYHECLRARGVRVHLGHFKRSRRQRCPHCGERFTRFLQKESDVAMATRMITLLMSGSCEAIVLLTGDGDLAPAIREARGACPEAGLYCLFPWRRHREELESLADRSFHLAAGVERRHPMPDPFWLPDGRPLRRRVF